ncbi:AAA family ATPase [Candidatus Bathyarchaeota archaeon]|nr:AAA family ATPase [Candidatus Bathyarchaeota archaeon]
MAGEDNPYEKDRGVMRMFRKRLENFVESRKLEHENALSSWNSFKKKDTYLCHNDMEKFKSLFHHVTTIPLKIRFMNWLCRKCTMNLDPAASAKQEITNYNKIFVERRLREYESFFDGIDDGLKYPLDVSQRLAVIRDDRHNLVVAGAGSGKTSVLTTRIAYLIRRKDAIQPERILALAYTRVAAKEMEERLKRDFSTDIAISTFHSLGYRIISEELGNRPSLLFDGNQKKRDDLVKQLVSDTLGEPIWKLAFIKYMAYSEIEEPEPASFDDKQLYFKYMANKRYTTLDGIEVKSLAEREIGNFLFVHGIQYEYEMKVDWVENGNAWGNQEVMVKTYHPDFYIPTHDLYIEHWGLNRRMEVPSWFSKSSEEYKAQRNWKLDQFSKNQKKLIETWEYEHQEGILLESLQTRLEMAVPGIEIKPLNPDRLVSMVHDIGEKQRDFNTLVDAFISTAKANFLMVEDIRSRIASGDFTRRQVDFGTIACEVYRRYQQFLKQRDEIDFDDMIIKATKFVLQNPGKYESMYDHVLVDEFQDISYQRMQLIRAFVNPRSSTKLFCVGDDWQSIYQFSGSDVSFFVNFHDQFSNPTVTTMETNYRSTGCIVRMSNDLISRNKFQLQKVANATKMDGIHPLLFILPRHTQQSFTLRREHYFKLLEILLENGVDPSEIMVLSRFNRDLHQLEIFCGAHGMPTESKHGGIRFYSVHKAKGSEAAHVILMDVLSGMHGFPCEKQDSTVLDLAKRMKSPGFIEEERRLFYVGLTRSKQYLYIFTVDELESMFIDEIRPHVIPRYIDRESRWNEELPRLIVTYMKGSRITSSPTCNECKKGYMVERSGKFGTFLGCSNYPDCRATMDPSRNNNKDILMNSTTRECKQNQRSRNGTSTIAPRISCPRCGHPLVPRKGRYGMFLGCKGYPRCKFTFNLSTRPRMKLPCPACKKGKIVGVPRDSRMIARCSRYPRCQFSLPTT